MERWREAEKERERERERERQPIHSPNGCQYIRRANTELLTDLSQYTRVYLRVRCLSRQREEVGRKVLHKPLMLTDTFNSYPLHWTHLVHVHVRMHVYM